MRFLPWDLFTVQKTTEKQELEKDRPSRRCTFFTIVAHAVVAAQRGPAYLLYRDLLPLNQRTYSSLCLT